jgi:hypothetical protein
LERETGIEPATNGLGSRYSTIELLALERKTGLPAWEWLTLPPGHFGQRSPNQILGVYMVYFQLFEDIAFLAPRGIICTCFPEFLEKVDSMDSKSLAHCCGFLSGRTSEI